MAEYQVKSGDTLSKIATQNKTTVADLAKLNNIADVNKINVGQRINLTPAVNTGSTITGTNTQNTQGINVTQPQIATGATTLQSDIISKGQADTARAVAEEARIATQQGSKAPTATQDVLKNILGVNTQTPATTGTQAPTVDNTMSTTNVNGITADTIAQQRQGIQDTLSNIQGETRLTADQYAGTVDPAKAELNAINTQLNDEALAGRRRTEAVLQIPGITKEQAQDKINEISRVNASKLADLAVVQMAKQGQYDSAKEIADRAVQAKVEDQKNKLNALMFTYTENKELFTKAEQRAFETAQADRERKLNAEEKNLQRISDLSIQALQDGAPASVVTKMRNAKTEAEAIALGGQYIGRTDRLYKQAQTQNIYSEINKRNADAKASSVSNAVLSNPQYAGALNVILGSEKFTKDQKNAVVAAVNKGQDPVQVIKNQAKNIMGETTKKEVDDYETAIQATKALEQSLKAYYDAGGKTNVFKGNMEKTINKLGEVQDPKLVSFSIEVATQLQLYKKAITGTASSDQESKDISTVFPGINKSSGLNKAIIDGRIRAFETQVDSRYRNTLGSTYDELKPKPAETPQQPANPFLQSLGQTKSNVIANTIFDPAKGYILPTIK